MDMPHMTPDEFRQRGKEVIDWIADYRARVASMPVVGTAQPGDLLSRLPTARGQPLRGLTTAAASLHGAAGDR